VRAHHVAEEDVASVDDLIMNFQLKKNIRANFKNKSEDDEMQAAHQRLLKQFVDIDRGKRLSVGPAHPSQKTF
jgi:hypothetical protein